MPRYHVGIVDLSATLIGKLYAV